MTRRDPPDPAAPDAAPRAAPRAAPPAALPPVAAPPGIEILRLPPPAPEPAPSPDPAQVVPNRSSDAALPDLSSEDALPGLAALLHACVQAGASVGFVQPHPLAEAEAFWRARVLPGVAAGGKILFLARAAGSALAGMPPLARPLAAPLRHPLTPPLDGLLGCVVLGLDALPNGAHRGEVSKLLVHPAARRRGIARALMAALHAEAARQGRSLLVLDTRSGDPSEALYRSLGYQVSGQIPHYCQHPDTGALESTTVMWVMIEQ